LRALSQSTPTQKEKETMVKLPLMGVCLCLALTLNSSADDSSAKKIACWPEWRGPLANGVALDANPPTKWSESLNVRWKISVPGKGHSSPIVWNDRVIVTTAVPTEKAVAPEKIKTAEGEMPDFMKKNASRPDRVMQFVVLAFKRSDGSLLWKQQVYVSGRNGVTAVIRSGPTFEAIATNSLDESFSASAALAEKDLYLRGQKSLYCISE
jgi:hypothetical protein